jgi:hypothetical protein
MATRNDARRRKGRRATSQLPTVAKGTRPRTATEAFAEIRRLAINAQADLDTGAASTGASALSKIRYLAEDGERWSQ